jgi:pyruvate kinase
MGRVQGEYDHKEVDALIRELSLIATRMRDFEEGQAAALAGIDAAHASSARNLLHYLSLRTQDIRSLQERLQPLGLSSLGRAEAHVLGNVHAVLRVLHALVGRPLPPHLLEPVFPGFGAGQRLLERRTAELLGVAPAHRVVRVMVTMPSEAAHDFAFVRDCLAAGMNLMRINCSHDDAPAWERMIVHLRRAQRELDRPCRILMDLGGPKLRTGPVQLGPAVVHWKPQRDALGRVRRPARVWLTPWQHPEPPPEAPEAVLPVREHWLEPLAPGDVVEFVDTRGSHRRLDIVETVDRSRWGESDHTAYIAPATELRARRAAASGPVLASPVTSLPDLPRAPLPIRLHFGDRLVLTREPILGTPAEHDARGRVLHPARIACTLPEVFAWVRPGEPVWIDDGKIGGIVRAVDPDALHLDITHAPPHGAKLHADRGINFPESDLHLPALTNRDLVDLPFVAAHADLVGLSYVQCAEDVRELRARLRALDAERVGVVLKIETRRAFERLPELLLAAMRGPAVGVMIARGDLAVECGWERLAELQEEILWISEAGHVPVIWATQVLESLAKTGLPSRAEITDAAMGVRAECVMLNKGPHVVAAIRVLDAILTRMQAHQTKKTPRLRRLRAWSHLEPLRTPRPGSTAAVDAAVSQCSCGGSFVAGPEAPGVSPPADPTAGTSSMVFKMP